MSIDFFYFIVFSIGITPALALLLFTNANNIIKAILIGLVGSITCYLSTIIIILNISYLYNDELSVLLLIAFFRGLYISIVCGFVIFYVLVIGKILD